MTELEHGAERAGAHTEVAEVVAGATVQILADQAAHAQLLALASYGPGAWTGMLAGSVALGLSRAARPSRKSSA